MACTVASLIYVYIYTRDIVGTFMMQLSTHLYSRSNEESSLHGTNTLSSQQSSKQSSIVNDYQFDPILPYLPRYWPGKDSASCISLGA